VPPERSRRRVLATWGLALAAVLSPGDAVADEVSAAVYVRTDTDGTDVVSPRVRGRAGVIDDQTFLDVGYAADVWTSASIDVRTAATRAVTEQRDELTAGVSREMTDVTMRAGYRYSVENDYTSHGGAVAVEQRLAEGAATVETQLSAAQDTVGRSGDDGFQRGLATVGARVAYTQVLDADTILQGAYELSRREGYQASPYRFVGVGGDGRCGGTATLCLPESVPPVRLRHAIVARVRRSLGASWSGGLEYRLYVDDWGLGAHTGGAQLAWLPDDRSTVSLRYRFHVQGSASFYRARYETPTGRIGLVTNDRELSALRTHRVALGYERDVDLTEAGPTMRITAGVGLGVLGYQDFPGLDTVLALDATLAAAVEL
jgi:hypothetical protein